MILQLTALGSLLFIVWFLFILTVVVIVIYLQGNWKRNVLCVFLIKYIVRDQNKDL